MFSIAASHTLLALALVALLLSGEKLRLPRFWPALCAWFVLTLVSLALSPDPAHGLPQVRKFYVYLTLLVCFSLLRELTLVRRLLLAIAAAGSLDAARGLVQFANKVSAARAAGQPFYEFYVADRITGFASHWMTFGGKMMVAFLVLGAFLLFAGRASKHRVWFWLLCLAAVGSALVLNWTRSIWGAAAVGALYLIWNWKRWWVAAAPVALLAGFLAAPGPLRTRVVSVFEPQQQTDSNEHRRVCRRVGYRMIQAHPWFGIGPKQVEVEFKSYLPPDVVRLPRGWYGHLHNIYVHYAAELGVPALLALLWMLGQTLYDYARALRRLPPGPGDRRFILHAGIAVVLATLVAGFWEVNLGDSEVLGLFLAIVSSGYVAVEQANA